MNQKIEDKEHFDRECEGLRSFLHGFMEPESHTRQKFKRECLNCVPEVWRECSECQGCPDKVKQ